MKCEYALELVSPYVDSELDSEEAAKFHEHVSQCASCGSALAEERQLKAMLCKRQPAVAPDHLISRISFAIAEEKVGKPLQDRVAEELRSWRLTYHWRRAARFFLP